MLWLPLRRLRSMRLIEHPLPGGRGGLPRAYIEPRAMRLSTCDALRINARLPRWTQKREVI
jgi:hypothetical protein